MLLYTIRVLNQILLGTIRKIQPKSPVNVQFICWPIDLDTYMHMNNACYFRVAELARWRLFPSSNFLSSKELNKLMFIVVEQDAIYKKSIKPFQRYIISTTIHTTDDKYLHYTQRFLEHPSHVKTGQEPVEYAIVNVKAVLKERSGKTYRPSDVIKYSSFAKDVFNAHI